MHILNKTTIKFNFPTFGNKASTVVQLRDPTSKRKEWRKRKKGQESHLHGSVSGITASSSADTGAWGTWPPSNRVLKISDIFKNDPKRRLGYGFF